MTACFTTSPGARFAILAGVVLVGPGVALAQPDPKLKATYGSVTLKAGFLPDPHAKQLTAGGTIRTNLGGVNANVAKAPDYKLFYTAGAFALTIHVESAADTTLLVNLPDGTWVANDDGGKGLNPLLRFAKPQSGRYDIWVGTFGPKTAPATLMITERNVPTEDPVIPVAKGNLDGSWVVQSMVVHGQPMPAVLYEDHLYTMKGGKLTHVPRGKSKVVLKGTMVFDNTTKPGQVELRHEDAKKSLLGIFRAQGDTITLCYGLVAGAARPAHFVSRSDTKTAILVLKRSK
jgi:uncharacterized protein (TIGR03067 family)